MESSAAQDVAGNPNRIGQRNEMPAGQDIRLNSEAIARDATLELEREEPVPLPPSLSLQEP